MVDYTLLSLLIGGIGAITGIWSMIWHIRNQRPNLVIARFYYTLSMDDLCVYVWIKNKSNRGNSIISANLTLNNRLIRRFDTKLPIHIKANFTEELKLSFWLDKDEIRLFKEEKRDICLQLGHTFGEIKKCIKFKDNPTTPIGLPNE